MLTPSFFVARTDVDSSSGLQRNFGVFDDETAARRFITELQSHIIGSFEVFEGVLIPKPE